MSVPKVSVVLNAYNGDPWIDECIQSVLAQTMGDFEFIVIDDGSTDGTWAKINSYKDSRMRAFTQENRGISATANRGVSLAKADYIARIDHDDVMMPTRLERELAYLQDHPDVALVCTYAQLIYENELSADLYRAPVSSPALRLRLVFENPVVQPTVMMRTDVVRKLGGYNEDPAFFPADDFELWTRMAFEHNLVTIPEALSRYRIRPSSASHQMRTVNHNVLISANSLHRFLRTESTYQECTSLAAIFHRLAGEIAPLGLQRALAMFDRVTDMIAGPKQSWDHEVKSVYGLQRRMIFFHHILRKPPGLWFAQHVPALRLR
jgi:glycosyltransferase involved in cell wall biosynthesis